MVSIKHTRVMQNANGNDVTVMDYEEQIPVDDAIGTEETKARLEAELVDVEAELAQYIAIRDVNNKWLYNRQYDFGIYEWVVLLVRVVLQQVPISV